MDNPNMTMEEYIKLKEGGRVFNWETATYGKTRVDDNLHELRSVEAEFLAIVIDDAFAPQDALPCKSQVSTPVNDEINFRISFDESNDEDYAIICDKNSFSYKMISVNNFKTDSENDMKKPTLSPQHNNESDLNNETSLFEHDEVGQNILYFNDLFPFNVIHPDDLKSDEDNDNKIDIIQFSEGNLNTHRMLLCFIMNFYVPFGIPFDPKRYYKDGDCTLMLPRPRFTHQRLGRARLTLVEQLDDNHTIFEGRSTYNITGDQLKVVDALIEWTSFCVKVLVSQLKVPAGLKIPALAAEEEQVLVLILGLQVLCKGCQGTPTQSAAHFKVLSPSTSASFEAVFKPLRPIQVWNAEEQQTAAEVSCSISNKRLSISVPHNATSKAPTQAVETTKNEEVARKIQAYGMLRRKKEIESRRNLHDYRAPSYMIHLMEMYLLSHRANITSAFDTLRDTHYWRRLNQVMMKFWKDQEEWEIIRRGFHESSDSNTRIEYGTNSHVLLKRRYPHIKRVE
ncbi:hypothetical protein Tco_0394292 [Tanacetum coccineum]